MVKCVKCSDEFNNSTEFLVCSECKGQFHINCTKIETLRRYNKMSVSAKSSWKCESCKGETSSAGSRGKLETATSNAMLADKIGDLFKNMSLQFQLVEKNFGDVKLQITTVNVAIDNLKDSISSLQCENETRKKENAATSSKVKDLEATVIELEREISNMQQRSRINNLEIVGVPYTTNENVYTILGRIARVIKVDYNPRDISVAHRLPIGKNKKYPSIIVQFVQRCVKAEWIAGAKQHRNRLTAAELSDTFPSTSIFLNEQLTPLLRATLGHAKQMVREKILTFAWSKDGKVLIRRERDGPATRVWTPQDVNDVVKAKGQSDQRQVEGNRK